MSEHSPSTATFSDFSNPGIWFNIRKYQRNPGLTVGDFDWDRLYSYFVDESGKEALQATLRHMRAITEETDRSGGGVHVVATVLTGKANQDLRKALEFEGKKLKILSAVPDTNASLLDWFAGYLRKRYGTDSVVLKSTAAGKFPDFTFYVGPTTITIE